MHLDPWILAFSALTVLATIGMGFWSAKRSKTAHDFYVAGRSVSVGWNASAISGEYLSAASFMGVAGMVMSSGYDALWYPVCYACGYLFLLLFIAGPLRRFGAYTIPDFAEGRFDSPVFRKIAVVFVLFIGFFYTMPQMKGAGTTLAYIFPGLPYWAGVLLVGAVITLNVALGGMKGITLVQAFQYWLKMFAISVPIFVLMAVYGHYGKQLGVNLAPGSFPQVPTGWTNAASRNPSTNPARVMLLNQLAGIDAVGAPRLDGGANAQEVADWRAKHSSNSKPFEHDLKNVPIEEFMASYSVFSQRRVKYDSRAGGIQDRFTFDTKTVDTASEVIAAYDKLLAEKDIFPVKINEVEVALLSKSSLDAISPPFTAQGVSPDSDAVLPDLLKSAKAYGKDFTAPKSAPTIVIQSLKGRQFRRALQAALGMELRDCRNLPAGVPDSIFQTLAFFTGWKLVAADSWPQFSIEVTPDPKFPSPNFVVPRRTAVLAILDGLERAGGRLLPLDDGRILIAKSSEFDQYVRAAHELGWLGSTREPIPQNAPKDETWLSPFGPLTTKAAKAAAARSQLEEFLTDLPLQAGTSTNADRFVRLERAPISQILDLYGKLVGRTAPPGRTEALDQLDKRLHLLLTRLHVLEPPVYLPGEVTYRNTEPITATQLKNVLETAFKTNGISVIAIGDRHLQALPTQTLERLKEETRKNRVQSLAKTEKSYALLYTYSLIIALVCGTAGLPHILVRFYTNPNGVAAKRTTMWVMILIGVFYLFPPVFGVMGRNLLPELYAATGAKGTDKVVLELPRILNQQGRKGEREKGSRGEKDREGDGSSAPLPRSPLSISENGANRPKMPWGSILSGITCAGAFAAFMSTFSGLLVSMTGALAHDVYGRMLRPKSTPQQRLRAFRFCAVIIGAIAILLGMQIEPFQINFMVGQAFAIAAASYFPLLFVSCWWRGLTMKGAAAGMLTGGLCAIVAITLTSFSDLGWFKLTDFWAGHPFLRILCEQPALWTVPLAIGLMLAVSMVTKKEIPSDIRMKMLVLHAPESLGLKQEYIQEHYAR